jgi:hypothetical protein
MLFEKGVLVFEKVERVLVFDKGVLLFKNGSPSI